MQAVSKVLLAALRIHQDRLIQGLVIDRTNPSVQLRLARSQELGDLWGYRPSQKRSHLREPEVGLRRVPFKGSPKYYLGLG